MFEQVINWCEQPQNKFEYELGHDYCDCVDYTDYLNVYLKKGYYFTVYYYPTTDSYAVRLYEKKATIAIVENITGVFDIIDLLGEYDLL